MDQNTKGLYGLIRTAALTIIWGAILSGPVATAISVLVKPQPPWQGVDIFVQHYHRIQTLPFLLGFVLIAGSCLFVAAAYGLPQEEKTKVLSTLALVSITVYTVLISLNYIIQTTYIPASVAADKELIPLLTMSNPLSLCWAIEMFGYLFQGVAFWLLYPLLTKNKGIVYWLLFVNLLLSIGGAVASCIDVAWVMSAFGLAMFILWNVVLVAVMLLIALSMKQKTNN